MLIGSMVVISRWFPADRFSTLSARVLSIGLVGNLLATTPLAWGTEIVGWRVVFGIVVAFTFVAAFAVWLIVRDAPPGHPFLVRKVESPRELLRGQIEVLGIRNLHFILVVNFCYYACTFTLQGLWGGPFLREIHGLTKIQSGNVLLAAVLAYQLGMLIVGPLDRVFDTRKWIGVAGGLLVVGLLATLALWSDPPVWMPIVAIVLVGFSSSCSTMIMAHGRGSLPDRLIGRGMATVNTSIMLGVACMQSLSGMILGAFEPAASGGRSELAYRGLFGFMAVVLLAAVFVYSRSEDIRPSEELRGRV